MERLPAAHDRGSDVGVVTDDAVAHPERLEHSLQGAGFEQIERLDLSPFAEAEHLPELKLADLPADQQKLGEEILRLRDRLDDLLFGYQDYGLVGCKPGVEVSR